MNPPRSPPHPPPDQPHLPPGPAHHLPGHDDLAQLRGRLPELMLRDEQRLRRRIDRAGGRGRGGDARGRGGGRTGRADALSRLTREVDEAEARIERRRRRLPTPAYPEGLPVSERKDEILAAVRDHQVVIVSGETGSGKTTQLPKICLELGRGVRGMIGHTQPRRIAARTVAERIADELGTPLGGLVGYTVRFTDRVGDDTFVKVMTDGILLAELQRDPLLLRYDTLIVDEAHERSLNIDFILGYVKQLLPRRPDLKVVITSATIDTERFAAHFGGAPIVEVSGRTYPVEIRYRPLSDDAGDRDQIQAVSDAVEELGAEGPGDVLVFLSGEREIRDTAEALRRMQMAGTDILPLYARLSAAEQHRAFQPHRGRRVVLATNVAETSLTVPGIRYVVDAGTARVSRYSRRTKVQRLPIEPVSRASADQRAGRCGRVAPGVCIRLYSEEDYEGRPEYTDPEILRTNLASVILQMAAIGLGDIAGFPFVDPPDARNIRDGVALLEELGALDPDAADGRRRLTAPGRRLAQLPVDPRIGRMVLEGDRNGCCREVMVIAAGLSIQDPRERPADRRQQAAEAHARFADPDSDFVAYLNLWAYLQEQQQALSSNQFRRLCKAEFLNYLRVREWQDIVSQLRYVARDLGIRPNTEPGDRNRIHMSLLAGLLSQIGMRDAEHKEYLGARNARFAIAAGSSLSRKPPRWVMAAELVETNRMWARVVARIQPDWAEKAGAHLLKRTYGEPYWDPGRGAAMTLERATLYGVPVVTSRRVAYGRVDPSGARDMFIHHALVDGEWEAHHGFLRRNRQLVERIRALEDRARRRDVLVGDGEIFDFYDRRIGPEVVSARHFDAWWKQARRDSPELLDFSAGMLMDPAAGGISAADYPDSWAQGDLTFALSYEFAPGSPTDGVTVDIPLAVLNRVSPAGFDWHVPGRREELVTALIRSLPKQLRRNFVPAPDHARAFLDRAKPGDGPLLETLAADLGRQTGVAVPAGSFDTGRLPDDLRITFRIVGDDGAPVASGKDLAALQARLHGHVRAAIAGAARSLERSGLTDWTIGTLPRTVERVLSGNAVRGYPALVDEGDSVAVRIFAAEAEQWRAMWGGTRRLLLLTVPSPRKQLQRRLTAATKLALTHAPHASIPEMVGDCITAATDHLMADHGGPAWDEEGFRLLQDVVRRRLVDAVVEVVTLVGRIVAAAHTIETRLDALPSDSVQASVTDVATQVARLVYPGFVAATGQQRLPDVLRYLQAADRRLDKLRTEPHRDVERMRRVQRLQQRHDDLYPAASAAGRAPELEQVRWMIEELRVSYFAQSLGTPYPVSEERIGRALGRLA